MAVVTSPVPAPPRAVVGQSVGMVRYNRPPNWPAPPAGWQPHPGWEPDASWGPPPPGWQVWVEDAPTQPVPWHPPVRPAVAYVKPAKHAHGAAYWLLVGWWWEPLAWLGRVSLWVIFWPVGLWRSARKGRKNRESRERRGVA